MSKPMNERQKNLCKKRDIEIGKIRATSERRILNIKKKCREMVEAAKVRYGEYIYAAGKKKNPIRRGNIVVGKNKVGGDIIQFRVGQEIKYYDWLAKKEFKTKIIKVMTTLIITKEHKYFFISNGKEKHGRCFIIHKNYYAINEKRK